MRFIIYGAGAIGGTIGMRLLLAGREVVLIARGEHLEAIRDRGLTLIAPGERVTRSFDVAEKPSAIDFRRDDVVLMCMKSQHAVSALEELSGAAPACVGVVCAQNGVANERAAARVFRNVYAMLVVLPALHLKPGIVVTHADGPGGVLDVGRYPKGVDAVAEAIATDLGAAGFRSDPDPAVMRLKYGKLLANLGNALQAVTGMTEGSDELARLLRQEALACYAAAEIDCASRDEMRARYAGFSYGEIPGLPRGGGSSWQSAARGTGNIESDYLNGEIVLLGRLHGIPTPANEALQALAAELARSRLEPGSFTAAEVLERIEALS